MPVKIIFLSFCYPFNTFKRYLRVNHLIISSEPFQRSSLHMWTHTSLILHPQHQYNLQPGAHKGHLDCFQCSVIMNSVVILNYLRSLSVPPSRKSLIGSGESCGFLDHSCGIECAWILTIPLGSVKRNHADPPASYPFPTPSNPEQFFFKSKFTILLIMFYR